VDVRPRLFSPAKAGGVPSTIFALERGPRILLSRTEKLAQLNVSSANSHLPSWWLARFPNSATPSGLLGGAGPGVDGPRRALTPESSRS